MKETLMLCCKNTVDKSANLVPIDKALELDNRLFHKYEWSAGLNKLAWHRPADRFIACPTRPENHEMIPVAKVFGK